MFSLHRRVLGSSSPDAPVAFVLHGILGSGRNILSFANKLQKCAPNWRFVVLDLRNHGASQNAPPGDGLVDVAQDLLEVGRETGFPQMFIAHSYGGKVALRYAELRAIDELDLWILDTNPSARPIDFEDPRGNTVLEVLRVLEHVNPPLASRKETIRVLEDEGLNKPIAMWLATNLIATPSGLKWVFDLTRIKAMVVAYYAFDAWPIFERSNPHHCIQFVRGEKSNRFSSEDIERLESLDRVGAIVKHEIEDAGHWIHIDQAEALLACIKPNLLA